jgi:streptogramin lyase
MHGGDPAQGSSRDALIIATGAYADPELRRLRAPAQDARALAEVLGDPAIGNFAVQRIVDQPAHLLRRAIERFLADRHLDDLLLLHLSCHGIKDDAGRLHFAATDTERRWLSSSAVSAADLNELMERCRARSIVLLLDCCYSGAFLAGCKGDTGVHVGERLAGRGRAILTATNAIEYAWEGEDLTGQGQPSVFTAAVVEGLSTGDADRDGDGLVSIDDLYGYTYERVRRAGRAQTPLMWALGIEHRLHLARTPPRHRAPRPAPRPVWTEPAWAAGAGDRPRGVWGGARADLARALRRARVHRTRLTAALATGIAAAAAMLVVLVGVGPAASPGRAQLLGIAAGPDGNVWFTLGDASTAGRARIGRITPGGAVREFALSPDSDPHGITAGPDGNLWFADRGLPGRIGRITPNGAVTEFPVPMAAVRPDGITSGPDGNLWFTAFDPDPRPGRSVSLIGRITTVGEITEFPVPTGDGAPECIVGGRDGDLWFTEYSAHRIGRMATSGTVTEFPVPTAATPVPGGIAEGPDGDLWFTDPGAGRIGRLGPDGAATELPLPWEGGVPRGIAAGPDGNLWFADAGTARIGRVSPVSVVGGFAVPSGMHPDRIAAGPDGSLWFTAGSDGGEIGRLTPAGAVTEFAVPVG